MEYEYIIQQYTETDYILILKIKRYGYLLEEHIFTSFKRLLKYMKQHYKHHIDISDINEDEEQTREMDNIKFLKEN